MHESRHFTKLVICFAINHFVRVRAARLRANESEDK
jgi:hypothetical protein